MSRTRARVLGALWALLIGALPGAQAVAAQAAPEDPTGLRSREDGRASTAGAASVRTLDGVVAVVGGLAPGPQVIAIFRSDVELRARMAILRERSVEVALGPLPENLLRASLSELMGEALIAVEAARLSLAPPSGVALAEERARLLGAGQRGGAARGLLRALGVNARELDAWVERRAIVNGFLQANLEGTLDSSSTELARLFEAGDHPFVGQPFEQARARFAEWLAQQRMEHAVLRWVQSLTQRTQHRVLVQY